MTTKTNKFVSTYFIQDDLVTAHFSLMFIRFNRFNKIFFKKISQLVSGGIIQKFEENRRANVVVKREEDKTPQRLSMDHLETPFAIIAVCWGVCLIVFAAECLIGHMVKTVNRIGLE